MNGVEHHPERPNRHSRPPRRPSDLHLPHRTGLDQPRRRRLPHRQVLKTMTSTHQMIDTVDDHGITEGIKNGAYLHLLPPPEPPPAPAPLRRRGQRHAGPRGQRGHVRSRERLPEHAIGESEVDLTRVEELVGGQRRNRLVEEEAVGGAYEGGGGGIPAVEVGEGLGGGDGAGVLSEAAVGGDDLGRRPGGGGRVYGEASAHGVGEEGGRGRGIAPLNGARMAGGGPRVEGGNAKVPSSSLANELHCLFLLRVKIPLLENKWLSFK